MGEKIRSVHSLSRGGPATRPRSRSPRRARPRRTGARSSAARGGGGGRGASGKAGRSSGRRLSDPCLRPGRARSPSASRNRTAGRRGCTATQSPTVRGRGSRRYGGRRRWNGSRGFRAECGAEPFAVAEVLALIELLDRPPGGQPRHSAARPDGGGDGLPVEVAPSILSGSPDGLSEGEECMMRGVQLFPCGELWVFGILSSPFLSFPI